MSISDLNAHDMSAIANNYGNNTPFSRCMNNILRKSVNNKNTTRCDDLEHQDLENLRKKGFIVFEARRHNLERRGELLGHDVCW